MKLRPGDPNSNKGNTALKKLAALEKRVAALEEEIKTKAHEPIMFGPGPQWWREDKTKHDGRTLDVTVKVEPDAIIKNKRPRMRFDD